MRHPLAREWLGRVALLLAGAAAFALAAEGVLRGIGYVPQRHEVRYRVSTRQDLKIRESATVLDCYASNPRDYFEVDLRDAAVRQHYAARGMRGLEDIATNYPFAVEFDYNSHGYRDRPFSGPSPDVLRVAVVGDSFTEGQGVRESETYPRVLEWLLNRRLGRPVEVLNLGYRGLDLPKLLEPFGLALALRADVIVYAMVLNDADRSDAVDRRWPRLNDWIMVRRPIVRFGRLDSRLRAFVADRYETLTISRDTTRWYQDLYTAPNRGGWERTKAHIRNMKERADQHDTGFAVMLWPLLVGLDGDYPFAEAHERIARVCRRNGITFLDLLDTLRGRSSASLWAHPADLHPNELGHQLAAEALAPIVEALLE